MVLDKINLEQNNLSSYIIKIERSYKKNLELKKRLNHYAYEPRTYKQYQKLDDIKLRMKLLHISHLNLMHTLKEPANFVEVHLQKINEQLEESKLLDISVNEYINSTKSTI